MAQYSSRRFHSHSTHRAEVAQSILTQRSKKSGRKKLGISHVRSLTKPTRTLTPNCTLRSRALMHAHALALELVKTCHI